MLANAPSTGSSGGLSPEVHLRHEQLHGLLDFIVGQLAPWRDDPDRRPEISERRLTDQLCDYLNSAARKSRGWDMLQFRTEIPDAGSRSRSIDLSANPCATTVFVEGRRHTQYDMLLPIECKRLPVPTEPGRDEREYVFSESGSVGGIHRFKIGAHAEGHVLAGMIAYIQSGTASTWSRRIGKWIMALAKVDNCWSPEECLVEVVVDKRRRLAAYRSEHPRSNGLPDIEIRHLWVVM